jgi:hypothetical protein
MKNQSFSRDHGDKHSDVQGQERRDARRQAQGQGLQARRQDEG